MSAIKQLLTAQNEFVNPVFNALNERSRISPIGDEEAAKNEAALLVGGILVGVKIAIMHAAKLIEEMELDDVM